MKSNSNGVIYIATGNQFISEAINSARSLKKVMPKISVTLFTDKIFKSTLIDNIVVIKNPSFSLEDKVRYMDLSPYDRTIFLDTETLICDDLSELFALLDFFDIAAVHVPKRKKSKFAKDIPGSFTPFNTGVLVFRKNMKTQNFFKKWIKEYVIHNNKIIKLRPERSDLKERGVNDQPTFRALLYKSDLRIATLTTEYNFRGKCGYVVGNAKIIHINRRKNSIKTEKNINKKIGQRIFVWDKNIMKVIFPPIRKLRDLNQLIGIVGIVLKKLIKPFTR